MALTRQITLSIAPCLAVSRKVRIERNAFTRKLRVWGACGCVLGLVVYALAYRYGAASAN